MSRRSSALGFVFFILTLVRPAAGVTVEARSAYGSPGETVEVRVHIRTMGTRVDGVQYDLDADGIEIDAGDCDRGDPIAGGGVHVSRVRIGGFADDTLLQTCVVQLPNEAGSFPLLLTNVAANGASNTPLPVSAVAGEIGAGLQTPTPTPTPTPGTVTPACGNFDLEFGEACDDGNTVGADGCAINCTDESQSPFVFRSGTCEGGTNPGGSCNVDTDCPAEAICTGLRTTASAQGAALNLLLGLHGAQTVRVGHARDHDVIDKNGALLTRKGEIPVAFNLPDSQIDAIPIPPFACACVRFFGLGTVAARGVVACDDAGLEGVDYDLATDHDASAANPQCIGGLLEQPSNRHPGACNIIPISPEFSGSGPRGSAVLETGLAIALYEDGGRCCHAGVDPDCEDPFFKKGFDGIPCNADDIDIGDITRIFLTTGTARTSIETANAVPGARIATGSQAPCATSAECPEMDESCVDLETQGECTGSSGCQCRVLCGTRLCAVENTGQPFDCDLLAAGGPNRFAGGILVSASVLFDSIIGDNAITSTLVELSSGDETPTASPTATHSPTTTASVGTPVPSSTPTEESTAIDTETPTQATTSTPTSTPSDTPTPSPTPPCPSDCNRNRRVTVEEIVTTVNLALGIAPVTQCPPADIDNDGSVTVDEIVRAVGAALNGCA